jgi:hypothetical protein
MSSFFQKIFSGFSDSDEAPADRSERLEEYEQIFKLAKKKDLSPEKKAELEALYVQLIKKSDNVTSGQLQFLGLAEIKEKMGPQKWPRLQTKVYATAEEVIRKNISISDIHFLFKEDRYVIIFTQSSDEEINRKVGIISDEIMRRLALLDEDELQSLQIQQEITKVDVETFLDNDFHDMLDYVFKQYNPGSTANGNSLTDVPSARLLPEEQISLAYNYLPMWDLDKKTLTTYMCLAQEAGSDKPLFENYKALFQGKSQIEKSTIDLTMLEKIIEELERLEIDERSATLICPVQHETLYNFNSYDEFKSICQTIPNGQRESLIFQITNSGNFSLPAKDPFWFIPLLKDYCGGVFIDIPMRDGITFHGLKNSGAIGMGLQYAEILPNEDENVALLAGFIAQAKYFKMKKTFVHDVPNTNVAGSLAKMGFTYLSGPVVCGHTAQPERYLDRERQILLSKLAK